MDEYYSKGMRRLSDNVRRLCIRQTLRLTDEMDVAMAFLILVLELLSLPAFYCPQAPAVKL